MPASLVIVLLSRSSSGSFQGVYLAVLMDLFTRVIRGWHVSQFIDQELMIAALNRALGSGGAVCCHQLFACGEESEDQYSIGGRVTRKR
ncbi:MAG: hypothetical protein R3B84_16290 [Zavarzinella sp.]